MLRAILLSLCLPFSTAGLAADAASPLDLVKQMYRSYAWEAIAAPEQDFGAALQHAERTELERYFTPELAGLILSDREAAEAIQDIGAIDFALLWASQDPAASQLQIEPAAAANRVRVSYVYPGDGSTISIDYDLSHSEHGWRIRDIDYADGAGTLLERLQAAP